MSYPAETPALSRRAYAVRPQRNVIEANVYATRRMSLQPTIICFISFLLVGCRVLRVHHTSLLSNSLFRLLCVQLVPRDLQKPVGLGVERLALIEVELDREKHIEELQQQWSQVNPCSSL